jgi:uncharacterized repeat protein (TIGR01451 family)
VNPATGAETLVYANYPGGNAATLAQRPSDGLIFYAINLAGGNGPVYTFNPATPGVAPVQIGTLGAGVGSGFRMAFSGAILYFMPAGGGADNDTLYSVSQTTGAATAVATITGTNSGGDMAFNGAQLNIVDQNRNLYTTTAAGGAATFVGTIAFPGGATPNTIGMAFSGASMRLQTVSAANGGEFWSVAGTTATLLSTIGGGGSATGDMSNATVPLPNLSITKTDGVTTVYRGGPVTYTIVVTNSSVYPVTGTVTDTVPASVTGVTWDCVPSAGSTCIAASGSGNAINTSATLLVGGTATYTVSGTIAAGASGTLTNTATVAVPTWLTDSTPANNTATDTDTINLNADLSITKTDGLTAISPGSPVTYTIVVSNAGPDTSNGSIVTDTLPGTMTGVTWTCGAVTGGATCGAASGSGSPINTTANLPPGSSVTYTVSGTLSAAASGTLTNTARVITPASGVSDPTDLSRTGAGNNSATDTTTIVSGPDLRIAKTHGGNFTVGVNGTYTLTARNTGNVATSGTITVIDNLPAGLTIAAPLPSGTGWNCLGTILGSSTATCTSSTAIGAGATSPNPITVNVVVAAAAFPSVTNAATISGGNEPAANNGNNSITDPTTVNGVADVRIAKSHSGNFTVGVNGTYTLTASNSGTLATSGTITVIDTLPTGLTIAAPLPSGTGWNCSGTVLGSSTATCTSSTAIGAGATSPNPITVNVVVAPAAFPSVTNAATISGGGEPAYNNGNNSASDPTTVNGVADVRIAKSHSSSFTVGVNGTYTLTASNSGTLATSGTITVVDNLPSGLTIAAPLPTGTGWTCTATVGGNTVTCTSSTAIAAGATSPNPITVTVAVAPAAFPSVTNTATISGGGEPAYNNGNNSASDPTTVNGIPDLTIAKTHTGNFTQGQSGVTYSITVTNSGTAATSGTVTVTDTLPSGLTATGISGVGWICNLGSLTCTRSNALPVGLSYPIIALTVDVSLTAPATVTNTAVVSGGGENNASNNTANDLTTINAAAPPSVSLVKSVSPGGTQLPGTDLLYTITYTNTGGQPANNLVIVDPNPANVVPAERVFHNVDFKVGSLTSSPGTSGLVASFQYSNDGGTTWTYIPVSGAGGAPAGYDRVVTNVRWSFAGSLSQTGPNNTGSVSLTVRIR